MDVFEFRKGELGQDMFKNGELETAGILCNPKFVVDQRALKFILAGGILGEDVIVFDSQDKENEKINTDSFNNNYHYLQTMLYTPGRMEELYPHTKNEGWTKKIKLVKKHEQEALQ